MRKRKIPAKIARKIRRFEQTAQALEDGTNRYFSITRLTSIKSLCEEHEDAMHFVFFLAERTNEKVAAQATKDYVEDEAWKRCQEVTAAAVDAMRAYLDDRSKENLAAIRQALYDAQEAQQGRTERVHSQTVRFVISQDVIVIEHALECFLYEYAAPDYAYRAARQYAERYDSSYGAGLIPHSAPMLRDIASFLREYHSQKEE